MRKIALFTACVAFGALLAVPAAATHGGPHPTFRTENTWLRCSGQTKVHQADWALTLGGAYTPWSTTPPSQSVQSGAGCGALDWGGTTNPVYSAVFQGTFTGNLRDMTLRVHNLLLDNARQTPTQTLRLYAEIDGIPLFPPGAQPSNGRTVTVTPQRVNSGATDLYEFTITNIGKVDANGIGSGAAREDGDGTEEHQILIYFGLHGTAFGQSPTGHVVGTWVWDTTEVPSGITFNPATPAAATVAANLPVYE